MVPYNAQVRLARMGSGVLVVCAAPANDLRRSTIGALIIRIGFWGSSIGALIIRIGFWGFLIIIIVIGALIIRIGFGEYYTIIILRNPQNPILIIKAPTLLRDSRDQITEHHPSTI